MAAILTKPFVILAGVSGTGKSKLAELTAEFYTSAPMPGAQGGEVAPSTGDTYVIVPQRGPADPDRFGLIPVRPDWIDNQSVLGFVNPITSTYESTAALDLILRANQAFQAAQDKAASDRYLRLDLQGRWFYPKSKFRGQFPASYEKSPTQPASSIQGATLPLIFCLQPELRSATKDSNDENEKVARHRRAGPFRPRSGRSMPSCRARRR